MEAKKEMSCLFLEKRVTVPPGNWPEGARHEERGQ
jgi:hypothetical protein